MTHADDHRWRRPVCWIFSHACVVCNALSGGGVFLFPLFVPWLNGHFSLTQSELSTIVLAGMMGQYVFAAGWGVMVDHIGPWACSLSASVLFLFSYGTFAYLIANDLGTYHTLAGLFFVAGCGRVASYFSAIFSSRTHGSGMATSVPMALSGLSPLVLSYIASLSAFKNADETLNTPKFIGWMAVGCGVIHIVGAVGLRHVDDPFGDGGENMGLLHDAERAQSNMHDKLVRKQSEAIRAGCLMVHRIEPDESLASLLKDGSFWGCIAVGAVITGTGEMVISNMGSIVMELPGTNLVATQIRLVSISGTLARLCTGPLADAISPPIDKSMCVPVAQARISRMIFPMTFLALLLVSYVWTALFVESTGGLWVLSVCVGIGYGGSWAILPSITGAIWGERNLGRNFGILSYAPLVGTPIFTYLYAWSTEDGDSAVFNWRVMFGVCAAVAGVAICGCAALARRWDGRL